MKIKRLLVRGAVVLSFIAVIASCAVNPVTGKTQIMLMSEQQEIAMGLQYDPQVISTFGEYKDADLQAFLQAGCDEMGKISHRPTLEYHIRVLDSPVINAFAVPGGYIYLTRGILAQLNNEAEVMGVMGHEMGHITARHSVSQQSKQQLGTLILIGGMLASEKFADYAGYALQGMDLLFLRFSRDDEREADRLGVEYSSKVGYDAHKMADFFQVLNKMELTESEGGVPTFLSTHPDPGDRYNSVNTKATEWQQKLTFTSYKVNEDQYMQLIDGIVYGEDPRQGYTDGSTFYHPEMKFRYNFPTGWKLENTPAQVNMAPDDGKALMIFTTITGSGLEAAAKESVDKLQLTAGDYVQTTVNGMPALTVTSLQTSQDQTTGQQKTIKVLSYFIDYGGTYYAFHGVAADADFNTYAGTFEQSMKSFSKLTDLSRINVKPQRIRVKKVARQGTFTSALTYFGVKQDMLEKHALLNDIELDAQVPAGKMIKIIGE